MKEVYTSTPRGRVAGVVCFRITLHHTATHCNTLQHNVCVWHDTLTHVIFSGATHCNKMRDTLQHTATLCNRLHQTATHCNTLQHTATHYNTLRHTATHCNTQQHTATHCNTLQHAATHATHCNTRNTLQHTSTHAELLIDRVNNNDIETCLIGRL